MREILFKAKTLKQVRSYNSGVEDGVWVIGHYYCDTGLHIIKQFEFDRANYVDYEIDPETLCQFTGLLDKIGNKIFENDILYAYGSYNLTVIWDNENARFYAEYKGKKIGHEDDDNDEYAEAEEFESYEIIGNKFDKENNQ